MMNIKDIYKEISNSNLRIWPNQADDLLAKLKYLVDCYILRNKTEKEQFRSQIPDKMREKLFSLGSAAAEKCLNSGDITWVKTGILAYIIGDFYDDGRDNIRGLVLLDYAAQDCGTTFSAVCRPLLPEASKTGRKILEMYISRDSAINTLKGMGVMEVVKDGKRIIVPTPLPWEKRR